MSTINKENIIFLGNERLQNRIDIDKWIPVITEHAEKFPKYKVDDIIKVFLSSPDQIKIWIVDSLIERYGKEFNICSVEIIDQNSQMIINGVPQVQKRILYYF